MSTEKRTFEIQHLSGRRIVGSWQVTASTHIEADRLSEPERRRLGVRKYRIAEVRPGFRQRHGGWHAKNFDLYTHQQS
jgi:hypothetical protein